ncbi:MAG TPA: hypothetical protein VFE82_17575 [Ramlibacter sp.]|jgi:tetratricopeptide (TPR) repeat protein|uniref:hypothetical protein n=1 Tax=Ramlibacter sp. TaxID=1917967 RepID=UPI002D62CCD4|nr:hypothetical protein [Ramlibacter sp.]HZY20284.1 hypothetical protein [Ramlibacter sp.]
MSHDTRFEELIARGMAASADLDADHAIACFTCAAGIDPASGIPHFLIGAELAGRGDLMGAEHAFAQAVSLAPAFHLARYQLGLLQFSCERSAVALATWEPLLDLPADDPLGHFVRGFRALSTGGIAQALQHLRHGLGLSPGNPALSADIAKIIQTVERLRDRQAQPHAADPMAVYLVNGSTRRLQ